VAFWQASYAKLHVSSHPRSGVRQMNFDQFIRFAVEQGASDVHLQTAALPLLRINGQIRAVESPPVVDHDLREFILSIRKGIAADQLDRILFEGLDFSYSIPGIARFRCNIYSHLGTPALVLRVIKLKIRTLEELQLPPVLRDITLSLRGMTLLTGTTGSGKSTTLAAMVDLINSSYRCKIITIEDPVEYIHTNQKAMISQLELGQDTPSFEHGLRQALREDPDVILVGELRDSETMRMALRAADTGHQVFATVHSTNAAQTIERIMAMVPPVEREIARSQLAFSLTAVISQRLAVTRDGNRRAAMEILRGGPVTSKFIMENKIGELSDYIATRDSGMQRFDQHLLDLYHQKVISGTEAMRLATNPEAVALGMRGIR
jgi:twitching motility protein PilT